MVDVASRLLDIGLMDTFSRTDSPVHRIDARAKLITSALFIVIVLSFEKYTISALLPYSIYPLFLAAAGGVPPGYVLRKMAFAAPFVLAVGMFNPLLDTAPMIQIGSVTLSAGWISFGSILLRFFLTVGTTIVLIAVTGLYPLSAAADSLGVPRVLTLQLMFFYRYLFVLAEETLRALRARELRSFGGRTGLRGFGSLAGRLLLRTLDRAERIHMAMRARGFDGRIHLSSPLRFTVADALFMLLWGGLFVLFRLVNMSELIGGLLLEHIG